MRARTIGICLLGLALSACASSDPGYLPRQFENAHIDQVTQAYGQPVAMAELDNGTSVYVYQVVSQEDWNDLTPEARRVVRDAMGKEADRSTITPYTMEYTRFRMDVDRSVTGHTEFRPISSGPDVQVLCTIHVIKDADDIVQDVQVSTDLCRTIASE